MNILFVLEYYPPHLGGIQVVFKNIAERMADRGHDVTVVTGKTEGTESTETRGGVTIHRTPVIDSIDRYTFTLTGLPKAVQLARNADIIHTSTWTGSVPAWLARLATGTPTVMTVHEVFAPKWDQTDMGEVSKRLHALFEQGIYSLPFDHYTVVSEYTQELLIEQGKNPADIDVVYNGIDTELFDPDSVDEEWMKTELGLEDKFVYTYFGRPGPFKGVEHLIRAVPRIQKEISNATLLMILSPEPADRYEEILQTINRLEIENHVRIMDPVERSVLPHYIGGSDCVVVPSISEGFGFTAAETCALEVPVVATTAGSLPEVISGDYQLVEPNSPSAIAEGVINIYRGDYDSTSVRHFEWGRAVDEYYRIYRLLTKSI